MERAKIDTLYDLLDDLYYTEQLSKDCSNSIITIQDYILDNFLNTHPAWYFKEVKNGKR